MKYKPRSRGVSRLMAHLILTPKYRKNVITQPMLNRLKELTDELCQKWHCELIEFGGEPNHVHIVFRFFPQIQLSKFINNLKSVTSRKIREEFPQEVTAVYGGKRVFWTEGYSIDSCGDAPLNVLVNYVQNQAGCKPQPHRRASPCAGSLATDSDFKSESQAQVHSAPCTPTLN